jgi:E3 ubiquitin-protein ligase HECTD2
MPPWSSRLLPTPIAPTPPSTSASGTEIQQHSTPIDLDQHSSVLASVHRDAAGTSQPIRNAPAHSRSASHPFPSLFGIGRRTERTHEDSGKQIGHDTSGGIAEPSLLKHLPRSPSYKESFTVAEGEFVTGNCATCDSTVRWPRQLDVYRCTICQMVNDLRPLVRKSLRTDHEPNFQVDLGQESREPPELSRIQRKGNVL